MFCRSRSSVPSECVNTAISGTSGHCLTAARSPSRSSCRIACCMPSRQYQMACTGSLRSSFFSAEDFGASTNTSGLSSPAYGAMAWISVLLPDPGAPKTRTFSLSGRSRDSDTEPGSPGAEPVEAPLDPFACFAVLRGIKSAMGTPSCLTIIPYLARYVSADLRCRID